MSSDRFRDVEQALALEMSSEVSSQSCPAVQRNSSRCETKRGAIDFYLVKLTTGKEIHKATCIGRLQHDAAHSTYAFRWAVRVRM